MLILIPISDQCSFVDTHDDFGLFRPFKLFFCYFYTYPPVGAAVEDIGAGDMGFDSQPGQTGTVSPTVRHRVHVVSELWYQDARPRRWAPPLVTRLGAKPQVE